MNSEAITSRQLRSSAITAPSIDIPFKGTKKENANSFRLLVAMGTILLLTSAAYVTYELQPEFLQLTTERLDSAWGIALLALFGFLLVWKTLFFAYNIFLYAKYKPVESVADDQLPTCTIIVPAYNEGKQVWRTLISLAESDYPQDKMQIVAIDDGSKDDTWFWIQKAKKSLGDRLTIHKQPENKGKRHALYHGFTTGTGEIFVTVDSDSIVLPDTLRNMASPFVTNDKCGAVAGNVQVLNDKKGLIPRMLNVSFVMSFEFIRSAESMLGSVLCTPGALSAYRKTAVTACLEDWINQTFMGQPSDIGEDRAMTNMILKQGQHVLFQRNAKVLTNVPENYNGLYKMFIRWDRSNVRENIAMGNFVFRKFRSESKFGTRLLFLNQWLKIVMAYPVILFMLYFIVTNPILFLSSTLFSILILSTFPVLFYASKHNVSRSFWAYSYSILYTFGLFWITPYAIATAAKRGWLTREIS